MTTLSEIVYDLWQSVRGNTSDDDILDERILKYWIHNQRALWLRNEFNKHPRTIDDNVVQDLGAIEMEIDDRIITNPYIQDRMIRKSVNKIPVTVERHNSPTITRVGSLDYGDRPFSLVEYSNLPWVGKGKFNRNEFYAFLLNGYMYVISDCHNPRMKTLKYINVRGVFENPEEAGNFQHANGAPCYTDDSPYPINKWLIPYLKDAILKADLRQFIMPIDDEANDANSNLVQVTNEQRKEQSGD